MKPSEKTKQIQKDLYYLNIAEAVLQKSTCLRRKYGAIIVKNDEVIATGYNGSPRGCVNCSDIKTCMRNQVNADKGKGYNLCLSVHAEMNCIISAPRRDMIGSTLYILGRNVDSGSLADSSPCLLCHRMIINAGIARVVGTKIEDDRVVPVEIDVTANSFSHRLYVEEYLPLVDGDEEKLPNAVKELNGSDESAFIELRRLASNASAAHLNYGALVLRGSESSDSDKLFNDMRITAMDLCRYIHDNPGRIQSVLSEETMSHMSRVVLTIGAIHDAKDADMRVTNKGALHDEISALLSGIYKDDPFQSQPQVSLD